MDSKTDFFSAPASTRFHGACEGGLCAHSLNVYRVLHGTFFTPDEGQRETAICALLHDLCKASFYKKGTRNVKNEATGQWEKVPSYSVEDMFPLRPWREKRLPHRAVHEAEGGRSRGHPLAHGRLRRRRPGRPLPCRGPSRKYPLAVKLHIADLEATYLLEQRGE